MKSLITVSVQKNVTIPTKQKAQAMKKCRSIIPICNLPRGTLFGFANVRITKMMI